MDQNFFQQALIGLPILIFSLTIHEYSHAWSAWKFGDPTAKNMGRMTLNPLAHLDLFGTIMMVVSQFRFGWAKPVPVNPMNLRNLRVADFWISAAGPISNLLMAFGFGLLFRMVSGGDMLGTQMQIFLLRAVQINVVLAVFNLLPLFPLDGSHMLRRLLPPDMEVHLDQFDRISPFLLLFLIISGSLFTIIGPALYPLISLFTGL